ncbi:hypothetical protein [Alicyclobacillus shizuokensis]|uniref:hypothetical protein n=1 Tax=Alicyclobacillus shizuokensis TaxID=392014 RepID=UPI000829BE32|nr:hypothetical protein [Alicyclobacillus shizuokensis]
MNLEFQRAIFATNAFADAYPDEHRKLWAQFEQEVPARERKGAYGRENVAYVRWLIQTQNPLFRRFIQEHVDAR